MDFGGTADGTMKSLLSNDYLVLAVRVFLGLLFIFASLDKIQHVDAFATSIANYKLLPSSLVLLSATILPWLELLCGFGMLFGILSRGSAFLAALMLAVFMVALVTALARGLDISCGCFTQDPEVGRISWGRMAEDLGLLALSAFLLLSRSTKFSLEYSVKGRPVESLE